MKLLVIEDDIRMAGLLRRGLAQEGWAVDVVRDALDARHAVRSTPFDAVVCDVGLPGGRVGSGLVPLVPRGGPLDSRAHAHRPRRGQ